MKSIIQDQSSSWKSFFGDCIDYTAVKIMESETLQGYPTAFALFPLNMDEGVCAMTLMAVDFVHFPDIIFVHIFRVLWFFHLFQSMMVKSKSFCFN